ncbi:MAG: hypothetical protein OXG05_14490 [Gammaproteobacteria bacterium]|nr:hypothetical protein [Gammaproteobacteria bacterium]
MMSLNRADALRRKLEEEHGFNTEQANGTLMVVDEMVETGFDRMLKEIVSLRSDMSKDIESLRTELGKDIESLRSDMDGRFKAYQQLLTVMLALFPFASAFLTVGLLVALASIFGDSPSPVIWRI